MATRLNPDETATRPHSCDEVAHPIADEVAATSIDLVVSAGRVDHSGAGLPTGTMFPIARVIGVRVVRAEVEPVEGGASLHHDRLLDPILFASDVMLAHPTARDPCLVRDGEEQIPCTSKHRESRGDPRQGPLTVHVRSRPEVIHEHAVSIEKDGRSHVASAFAFNCNSSDHIVAF